MSDREARQQRKELLERFDVLGSLDDFEEALPVEPITPRVVHGLAKLSVAQSIGIALLVMLAAVLIVAAVMYNSRPKPELQPAISQPDVDAEVAALNEYAKTMGSTEDAALASAISSQVYKWRYRTGSRMGKPLIGPDGTCYSYSLEGSTVFAVRDGQLLFSHPMLGYDLKVMDLCNRVLILRGSSLEAVNAQTGKQLWSFTPKQTFGIKAGPVKHGDRLLLLSNTTEEVPVDLPAGMEPQTETKGFSELRCMSAGGELLWRHLLPGKAGEALCVGEDGTSYYLCGPSSHPRPTTLVAVSATGTELWQYCQPESAKDSLHKLDIAPDGKLYLRAASGLSYSGRLMRVDPPSGRTIWQAKVLLRQEEGIAFAADSSLIVWGLLPGELSDDIKLYSLSPETGEPRWKLVLQHEPSYGPEMGPGGRVYYVAGGVLHCVSPEGSVLWHNSESGYQWRELYFGADGLLYVKSNGRLHALNPDGSEAFVLPSGGSSVDFTVDKDGVFYTSEDEELVAFKP